MEIKNQTKRLGAIHSPKFVQFQTRVMMSERIGNCLVFVLPNEKQEQNNKRMEETVNRYFSAAVSFIFTFDTFDKSGN